MSDSETIMVEPGNELMVWVAFSSVFVIISLTCFAICLLKGRWGFALLGLFTFGIVSMVGSLLDALPGSAWAKRASRRPIT
ncbi:MAG: hypothetical protein JHD02_08020 [Thermoleophilaceae bacterium]|nr:hypothetical protein [Thermoleophilaceae bacterium]